MAQNVDVRKMTALSVQFEDAVTKEVCTKSSNNHMA